MDMTKRGLWKGALAVWAVLGLSGAAEAAPPGPPPPEQIRAQIAATARANTDESDRSGTQLGHARRALWMQRLREMIGRDRAMRNMPLMRPPAELLAEDGAPRMPMSAAGASRGITPRQGDGRALPPPMDANERPPMGEDGRPPVQPEDTAGRPLPPPFAQGPQGAPRRRGPMRRETIAFHVDDLGTDETGLWREGFFYANRDLMGIGDLFMASYIRSKGIHSISAGYALPIGPDTELDVDFITQTSEIVGEQRSFGIEGHSYSLGVNLRHTLRRNRSGRTTVGLFAAHTKFGSDMANPPSVMMPYGLVMPGRIRALDTTENECAPYVELLHYGDSSVTYHKHTLVMGAWNDVNGSHRGFTKYRLDAFYEKDYAHGQRLSGRLFAQLADRRYLSGYDRFYIGGMGSVRGYKENLIAGDNGLACGVEYRVPLGASRRVSALAFLDYGTVSGGHAPKNHTMVGTGVGLACDFEDIHAILAVGFPLEREVGAEGAAKSSPARVHFMLHAMF